MQDIVQVITILEQVTVKKSYCYTVRVWNYFFGRFVFSFSTNKRILLDPLQHKTGQQKSIYQLSVKAANFQHVINLLDFFFLLSSVWIWKHNQLLYSFLICINVNNIYYCSL